MTSDPIKLLDQHLSQQTLSRIISSPLVSKRRAPARRVQRYHVSDVFLGAGAGLMTPHSEQIDSVRRHVSKTTSQERKGEFGQFMTPARIARFMASLFPAPATDDCRMLDPGAGIGALSCAFLDRCVNHELTFKAIEVFAYELDDTLRAHLAEHLGAYNGVRTHVIGGDFIEQAGSPLLNRIEDCTHAILNPPYKKINNGSTHRRLLSGLGIETVNLYSAFVALAIAHARQGAQIVAIIPRSFCNGPYYRSFRSFLFQHTAIKHIHLFHSRKKAFSDDDVLQENVIIRLECGAKQGRVTVTTSSDDTFTDMVTCEHPFSHIVSKDDPEQFIHVPTAAGRTTIERNREISSTLDDLGIQVSTGPVVDFRLREHLSLDPDTGTVPLLYPGHFSAFKTEWPKPGFRKPNAIRLNDDTRKWLYPNGVYCVVRRFSSKEEKRRIVASVVDPTVFGEAALLGFENHLNVFHKNKQGLPKRLADGLALYLNTAAVDEEFRQFNGHTQVNATDLRAMKYPSRSALMQLGEWMESNEAAAHDVAYHDSFEALNQILG